MNAEVLFSTTGAAAYQGAHPKTIYNRPKADKLPAQVQALRYRKSDLDAQVVRKLTPPPKIPLVA